MFSKYIVPALAVAGGAYAQCSVSATSTVTDATGATAIAGCPTFTGSIAVASSASGDIVFDGLQAVTGDLTGLNTANVTSISASTLKTINGALSLTGMTDVNSLNFPALTRVSSLTLNNLGPTLQSLAFAAGLNTLGSLTIAYTFIGSLTGVGPTTASAISVTNNRYLNQINFPLTVVTGSIQISGYGGGSGAADLTSLESAGELIITNVNNASFPALNNVTGLASFTMNHFTLLSLPNLTTSNGLTIDNNNQMTNFTLPSYTSSSGGIDTHDNTMLTGTISYPVLERVNGAINITGSFSALSMPNLKSVLGGANIISDTDIASTCSYFEGLQGADNVIQGQETCSPTSSQAATSSTAGSTGTSATTTSTHTGAAGLTYSPSEASAYTVFGLLAAFFGLLM